MPPAGGRGYGNEPVVKYGWFRASAAEIRLAGSNWRRRSRRSIACGEALGRTCWKGIFGYRGYCFCGAWLLSAFCAAMSNNI